MERMSNDTFLWFEQRFCERPKSNIFFLFYNHARQEFNERLKKALKGKDSRININIFLGQNPISHETEALSDTETNTTVQPMVIMYHFTTIVCLINRALITKYLKKWRYEGVKKDS